MIPTRTPLSPALVRLLLKGPGCLTQADTADREFGCEYRRGVEHWAATWREFGPVLALEAERAGVPRLWRRQYFGAFLNRTHR